ncbi:MAG TPA: hypothetical protein VIY27_06015 [Myxococcota bacterium]
MSVVRAVMCCIVLISTSCAEPPRPPLEVPVVAELVEADAEETSPPVEPALPAPSEVETVSVRAMLARIERQRWRAPEDPAELEEATVRALLAVCIGEEGWANPLGCKAIWTAARTTRGCVDAHGYQRACRHPSATRRRESMLSSLRRMSPRHTGARPTRGRRDAWTSTLTPDCEQPSGWPELARDGSPYAEWVSYEPLCEALVVEVRRIVAGEDELEACPPRSRPLAWGCDPFRRLAIREVLGRERPLRGCNDRWIAERRRLHRLDCGETENAYYCREGTPGCGSVPVSERELLERTGIEWSPSESLPTVEEALEALASRQSGTLVSSVP